MIKTDMGFILYFNENNIISPLKQELEKETQIIFTALNDLGNKVLDISKELVPIDTGALHNSSFITSSQADYTVIIGYGLFLADYNTKSKTYVYEYALEIHDNASLPHKNGRMSHFLEIPARNAFDFAAEFIGGYFG